METWPAALGTRRMRPEASGHGSRNAPIAAAAADAAGETPATRRWRTELGVYKCFQRIAKEAGLGVTRGSNLLVSGFDPTKQVKNPKSLYQIRIFTI